MYTIKLMYLSCEDSARTVSMLFFESVLGLYRLAGKSEQGRRMGCGKKDAKFMSRSSKLDPLAFYFLPV